MSAQYPKMYVPGFTSPTAEYTTQELLASTVAFRRRGKIFAGGQGVLLRGTVVAQKTADKLWYVYDNEQGDGRGVARGVLADTIDTGTATDPSPQMANVYISGCLKYDLMSGAEANAIVDLNARVDTVENVFIF